MTSLYAKYASRDFSTCNNNAQPAAFTHTSVTRHQNLSLNHIADIQ